MYRDITKDLIKTMFEKQNELNILTNGPDWKTNRKLRWYRAIWTECAELLDYTNWKWWKQQEISLKDIEIELIDIWHFALSDMMVLAEIDTCVEDVWLNFKNRFETFPTIEYGKIRVCTEYLAYSVLRREGFVLDPFVDLCSALNMNIEQIFKLYMGKNILNRFRQDNGYKEKKYTKIWNGEEDNVYLIKVLETTPIELFDFEEIIYNKLSKTYQDIQGDNICQKVLAE